jgi:hypothetical protein
LDVQYRVQFEEEEDGKPGRSLNLRIAGNSAAVIVASLRPKSIVHVTGEANAAGYAPGYSFGWLGKDDRTLFSDSYEYDSSVDAVVFIRSAFEPAGDPDVYGRQPGVVRGWVYLAYLEEIKSNVPEDAP